MSTTVSAIHVAPSARRVVRLQERILDIAAALSLGSGVVVFAIARRALGALAAGTYPVPDGVSYVARVDFHAAQSRIGLWLVGAGLIIGATAAMQHFRRSRRG